MAAASTRQRRAQRPIGANLVRIVALTLFLVFVLVPLYWMVMTSVKPTSDYMTIPPVWFPKEPTLVHYTAALFSYRGLQGLTNSLIVASAATVLSSLLGTMMAYSLARFNTGGQHLAFWVLSQRFLPPVAIILPIFLLFRGWGLYDTHVGLILIYTFMTLPLTVWMMYAYSASSRARSRRRRWSTASAAGRRCGWWRFPWPRRASSPPPSSASSPSGPSSSSR